MSADDTSTTRALADFYGHQAVQAPESMGAFWMPFTANRQFKAAPRLLASAEGMYYTSTDGRRVLDDLHRYRQRWLVRRTRSLRQPSGRRLLSTLSRRWHIRLPVHDMGSPAAVAATWTSICLSWQAAPLCASPTTAPPT